MQLPHGLWQGVLMFADMTRQEMAQAAYTNWITTTSVSLPVMLSALCKKRLSLLSTVAAGAHSHNSADHMANSTFNSLLHMVHHSKGQYQAMQGVFFILLKLVAAYPAHGNGLPHGALRLSAEPRLPEQARARSALLPKRAVELQQGSVVLQALLGKCCWWLLCSSLVTKHGGAPAGQVGNALDTVKQEAQQGKRTEQKTAKQLLCAFSLTSGCKDGMLWEPAHMYCFVCGLLDRFHHQEC